jgi:3'(2'), 5'-bisphosphate nucleotidase
MEFLEKLAGVAKEAGRAVLDVYGTGDYGVSYKEDRSPLTLADTRSHEIIKARLKELTPDIPVLSEEGKGTEYAVRTGWEKFYLVDPLDGTKEFINRNGEFTVNISMLKAGRPVLGVINVPVRDRAYYASEGLGAYRREGDGEPMRIRVKPWPERGGLVVVASRSHGSPELEEFLKKLTVKERISAGSSLKFCLVAEGSADIYPRFGPTWEWDTAAGHAILFEAGGRVADLGGENELAYNKEVLKHKGFIAAPKEAFPIQA